MKLIPRLPGWNYLEYLLLRGLTGFLNLLPLPLATRLAEGMGDWIYFCFAKRRKLAAENVERAFGKTKTEAEKHAIVRGAFRNLVTSLMEFFRIPNIFTDPELSVKFSGTEYLDEAFAKKKGVLLVISHLGSWELLAFLGHLRGYPCSVVGRPMKNLYIYEWVKSLRKKITLNHIDKNQAIRPVLSALHQNKLAAILIDQWAGQEGVWVDFFGSPTSTTSIPARLAKKTGCALIPASCVRLAPGKFEIKIRPPVPLQGGETDWEEKTTRELNRSLEDQIYATPGQWSWAHKRWKSWDRFQSERQKREALNGPVL